jgi:hypothetical protein
MGVMDTCEMVYPSARLEGLEEIPPAGPQHRFDQSYSYFACKGLSTARISASSNASGRLFRSTVSMSRRRVWLVSLPI